MPPRRVDKPVVVNFIGYGAPARKMGNLHFSSGLGEAAALAVELAGKSDPAEERLPEVSDR